jgi:hypothetical protein
MIPLYYIYRRSKKKSMRQKKNSIAQPYSHNEVTTYIYEY